MGEFADGGAVGFTTTAAGGRDLARVARTPAPVDHAAAACRALRRPFPLSRRAHARGAVSAEPASGLALDRRDAMVERDLALASYESRTLHLMHLSARASVDALRRAHAEGVRLTAEVTPHHPEAHRRGRALAGPEREDEPAARRRGGPKALADALRDGTISRVATDHAPHARHEKEVPFEAAPFGVTGLETAFAGGSTRTWSSRGLSRWRRSSSGCPSPARPAPIGSTPRGSRSARRRTSSFWTRRRAGRVTEDGFKSRSKNSWLIGEKLRGRVRATIAAGRLVHES